MSFQITLPGNRKAAARFVGIVRRKLLKALADNPEVKQTDIADRLNVHRSVITRQLKGTSDMSLSRVAEIAWALGYRPSFELVRPEVPEGANHASQSIPEPSVVVTSTSGAAVVARPKKALEVV